MPKQGKPKKKKKTKEVLLKTREERSEFVERIKKQFLDMGCFPGQYGAATEFFEVLDEYVENGTSASGKIDFPECPFGGRDIYFILSNRLQVDNTVHFLMKSNNKEKNVRR